METRRRPCEPVPAFFICGSDTCPTPLLLALELVLLSQFTELPLGRVARVGIILTSWFFVSVWLRRWFLSSCQTCASLRLPLPGPACCAMGRVARLRVQRSR